MKKFWLDNKKIIILLLLLFALWKISLQVPLIFGNLFLPRRPVYIGLNPRTNMDGIHYLSIAEHGYATYEQAFFPLFPMTINLAAALSGLSFMLTALLLVDILTFLALFVYWKMVLLDNDNKTTVWSILFFLFFPTAFFLNNVYTEPLFMLLVFSSLYFARKKHFWLSGLAGMFASATRLAGVFLIPAIVYEIYTEKRGKRCGIFNIIRKYLPIALVPLGLIAYILFLWIRYKDPLLFIHAQTAFGAGRSGGKIILLPQVLWRYIKIIFSVPPSQFTFWIAGLEIASFVFAIVCLYTAYKAKIRPGYLLFCVPALILPTLSGTLSSFPRYAISIFIIYQVLAKTGNYRLKYVILSLFIVLQFVLIAFYAQGYFVS